MTDTSGHLPECLNDDDTYGLRGLCICDELRACEQRVLDAAQDAVAAISGHSTWPDMSYNDGLADALAAIDALRRESDV